MKIEVAEVEITEKNPLWLQALENLDEPVTGFIEMKGTQDDLPEWLKKLGDIESDSSAIGKAV